MKMNRNTQLIKGLTNTMPVNINLLTIRDYYLLCKLILLALLLCHKTGHCQRMATESNNNNNASATTTTTTTTETTTTIVTSTPSSLDPAENVTSELILSAEEFVDSREVPLIVIDGTTNEDPPVATTSTSTTSTPRPTTTTATSSENSTQASSNISPPPSATVSSDSSHRPTSTTTTPRTPLDNLSSPAAVTTTTLPTTTIATTTPATTSPKLNESSGDPVLDHDEAVGDNGETTDETDDDTSDNGGQMLPNESDRGSFEPPQNISQYMDYIEKLFHDLRHQITHLFEPHLPQLIRTSQMVELTSSCSYDMLRMALALRQFEPWALRMIDSSGKVPEGIFEGSFTALGSYDECLGTIFDPGSSASESASSDQATTANGKQAVSGPTRGKYCLVTVSPFMPPKPPADKVELLFQEEANRRNYTRDDQFARLSPMFYYMKFRIGVCMPSTCDQSDMDSISGALSSSLRLNITIPDCRVQQPNQQLTRHQLIGGLTFALVSACVLLATLIDCFKLKWKQLECQDIEFIQEANTKEAATTNGHNNKTGQQKPQLVLTGSGKLIGNADHQQQRAPAATIVALENRLSHEAIKIKIAEQPQLAFRLIGSAKGSCGGDNVKCKTCCNAAGEQHLIERLRKHWTWMSFSLIANFRLYFQPETLGQPSGNSSTAPCKSSSVSTTNSDQFRQPTTTTTTIACLNGIRVLSLCWVIVANSYLTLDPRATKRLTKTREAPRDFLFQLVVQASLAIETFFFLSGLLMSLSFSKRLRPSSWTRKNSSSRETTTTVELNTSAGDGSQRRLKYLLKWIQFYVHRYVRMTPPTMLVIAFSMFAYHYGDGPLWFEATQRVHQSCTQNWWRHLLHVANFIDTRQMCFIHYWYIAADMQLFLFAPILLFLLFKFKYLGYLLIAAIGGASMASVFHTTYTRSLPPTLLFYSTDPESRREFGNTIMTKPMTHAMPYLVGMLVGWWCVVSSPSAQVDQHAQSNKAATKPGGMDRNSGGARIASSYPALSNNGLMPPPMKGQPSIKRPHGCHLPSVTGILGWLALAVALTELFLPYMWNNSHLPGPLVASIYAALFRFGWSLVLAYVVLSCRHRPGKNCQLPAAAVGSDGAANLALRNAARVPSCCKDNRCCCRIRSGQDSGESVHHRSDHGDDAGCGANEATKTSNAKTQTSANAPSSELSSLRHCYCGSGGNYLNRLLSLSIFSHLSKLSFVAYLIHLPLMSVFIGQTRGLFAFSHTLVIHFAISYLVISFALSFLLVHFIEFPFITFERLLFDWLFRYIIKHDNDTGLSKRNKRPMPNTLEAIRAHEKGHLSYEDPRIRSMTTRLENRQHQQQQHQHHHSLYPPSGLRTNLHPATNQLHRATTTSANQNHITTERL